MEKNLPVSAEGATDVGSIPRLGRFPAVGNGNLFQYSCLENSMEAWQATVHGATKSQTLLAHKQTHAHRRQYKKQHCYILLAMSLFH